MKIKYKLILGLFIFVLVMLFILFVNMSSQKKITNNYDNFSENILPGIVSLGKIEPELLKTRQYSLEFAKNNNFEFYLNSKKSMRNIIKYSLMHKVYHAKCNQDSDNVKNIDKIVYSFINYSNQYLLMAKKGVHKKQLNKIHQKMDNEFEKFTNIVTPEIEIELKETLKTVEKLKKEHHQIKIWLVSIFLTGLLIAFLLNIVIIKSILKSINKMTNNIMSIKNRKFDSIVEPNGASSNDELKILELTFYEVAKNLSETTASKNDLENEIFKRKQAELNSFTNEKELEKTLYSIGEGVIVIDISCEVIRMNRVAEKLTKWNLEEAKGKQLLEIFNIVNIDTGLVAENSIEEVLELNWVVSSNNRMKLISKEFDEFQISILASPIYDNKKNIFGVVIVFNDITERVKIEDEIKAAKDFAENLLETANSIMITLDKKANITSFNKYAEKITGYKKNEVIGKNWFDLFIPENLKQKIPEVFEKNLEFMEEYSEYENLINTKSNGQLMVSWRNNIILDNLKNIQGILSIGIDVTEKRKMEKELIESEKNLRSVFNAAQNVAFIKTDIKEKDAKIIEFSPGAENIFGYKREEIIGKSVSILHTKDDVEKFPKMLELMGDNKNGFEGESILVRKSGELFSAMFTTHPIFDIDKAFVGTIGVTIDITKLKEVENKLKENEDEYRRMIEQSADPIIIRQNNKIIFVNETFEKLVESSKNELIGHDLLITGKKIVENHEKYNKNSYSKYEAVLLNKSGAKIQVECLEKIINFRGEESQFVIFRDITEQKEIIKVLQKGASQIKGLGEFIPICAGCSKIRDDDKKIPEWIKPAEYITERLPQIQFSHTLCPDCVKRLYPEYNSRFEDKN